MSNSIRSVLHNKIRRSFPTKNDLDLLVMLKSIFLKQNLSQGVYSFVLPVKTINYDLAEEANRLKKEDDDTLFSDITLEDNKVCFNVDKNTYIKELLVNNYDRVPAPTFLPNTKKKNMIIEFSSPNIAKPFHVGHLRSSIIGNYFTNMNIFLKNEVKKINYLGDWGTQFGLVLLGINLSRMTKEEIKTNPIRKLYDAYRSANELCLNDPSMMHKARDLCRALEHDQENPHLLDWEICKSYTMKELKKTYQRLGISFDEYHWESSYRYNSIKDLLDCMERAQLLHTDYDNRKVIDLGENKIVPILKSDNTTLYITRDIAAAIDRFEKYKFDEMYYVVDNAQANHFKNMIEILKRMEKPWANRLFHLRFGRIVGMSTRKGTAVNLNGLLDEIRWVMRQRQLISRKTKVDLNIMDESADKLGVSALIINDLKQHRSKDYQFNWDSAFDIKGDTGISLQYTHCRLFSLEQNSGAVLSNECEPSIIVEPELHQLLLTIGKFDEVVMKSHLRVEPCILTKYLFELSHSVNKSLKLIRIKGEAKDVANQRLLVFHVAKNVLAQGLKLLGIIPLDRM